MELTSFVCTAARLRVVFHETSVENHRSGAETSYFYFWRGGRGGCKNTELSERNF